MPDIEIRISGNSAGHVCFEPNGMAYLLEPGERMYVRADPVQLAALQIEYWEGGVNLWFSGSVTTFDKDGSRLDELWGG
ncbi:hypothetical protein ALI144C_51940 [Actinosynnema sp. ALI-1.44]|uniref:hypothetical protein n=1 Tax=Actinosynnema sp. ALI-1.44 TaxID=1933779 RepID=UPI00097C9DA0|nr:hypothetical protein [Actinosynnema sp. ALI-1.44]ONI71349.1 hypothetical protein ALI144C_51940 [Actinosynnema sp. ALI-1.44]